MTSIEVITIIGIVFLFISNLSSNKSYNGKKIKKENSNNKNSVYIINSENEMKDICEYLSRNYKDFCIYPQILRINENERLPILQYIWKDWENYGTQKRIIEKYSQYSKKDLRYICRIEQARIYTYYHWQEDKKNFGKSNVLIKIRLYEDWRTRFCDISDEINVFNSWLNIEEVTHNSMRVCSSIIQEKLQTEYIYFWRNGDYLKMTPPEFKIFCQKNNYAYPFKN